MIRKLTLPREHGAYLTLAAAVVTATFSAPHPLPALGMGVVVAMAFLARGPLERLADRHALRAWDGAALGIVVALAGAGAVIVAMGMPGPWWPWAVAAAATVPAGACLARRARVHRAAALELVAMGSLGASAGLAAFCGGASPARAIALAAVLGTHAALSVPLLRTELRPRARGLRSTALLGAAAILALTVGALSRLGCPALSLALVPRAAQIVLGLRRTPALPRRPRALGVQETLFLAVVVVTVVAVSR